jgi:hypothetical protein
MLLTAAVLRTVGGICWELMLVCCTLLNCGQYMTGVALQADSQSSQAQPEAGWCCLASEPALEA